MVSSFTLSYMALIKKVSLCYGYISASLVIICLFIDRVIEDNTKRVYLWIGDETQEGAVFILEQSAVLKNNLNPVCWIPVLGMSGIGRQHWKDPGSVSPVATYTGVQDHNTQNACSVSLIISWLVGKSWIQVPCLYLTNFITWAFI